jgi:hypothetical protein
MLHMCLRVVIWVDYPLNGVNFCVCKSRLAALSARLWIFSRLIRAFFMVWTKCHHLQDVTDAKGLVHWLDVYPRLINKKLRDIASHLQTGQQTLDIYFGNLRNRSDTFEIVKGYMYWDITRIIFFLQHLSSCSLPRVWPIKTPVKVHLVVRCLAPLSAQRVESLVEPP